MAGSILAGCAVEAGRYRPRRWVRASRWAVAQTDSRSSGRSPGTGSWAGSGPGGVGSAGGDEAVAVDLGADQHDVLGVDQAGGAGGGDHAPGGVGKRAAVG